MKNLHLVLLALLVVPQNNHCLGRALGSIMNAAVGAFVIAGGTCVVAAGYGAYRVGKKTYNYIKLTPDTCKDAETQMNALINNPKGHTEELNQLFDTLAKCQNKFGK